jgi:glycosyltransferase involved in cell wall biosynthesis
MSDRPKLLFLIPHLRGGGAARVTRLLAENLSPKRFELHLGVVTEASVSPVAMPAEVSIHPLGSSRVRAGTLRILRMVRRLKPDVIVCGMAHLSFLVLILRPLFPSRTRVLIRQNSTASAALEFGALPWYTGLLYKLLYHQADRILCQTSAMGRDLAALLATDSEASDDCSRRKNTELITVLPNPVDVERIRAEARKPNSQWKGPGPHLLAIGRLSPEKGFDLLLRAFFKVILHFPHADLTILGSGSEEASLRRLAVEFDVSPAVRFAGHVDSPAVFFPGATSFVLSSRHEGMPNALLEAAAAGLPIVALPASQGMVELIEGQDGIWLAHSISADALSDTLIEALQHIHTGLRFPHAFVDQFRIERSIGIFQKIIDSEMTARQGMHRS